MAQVIRSGAFLQQCWSVHPLCVSIKRLRDDRAVVLSCSSCKSTHYLTVATVSSKEPLASQPSEEDTPSDEQHAEALLKTCVSTHHTSLSLREMDVFQDLVRLRCTDCRRQYKLTISAFETRHK
ncbi:MAG: hypothetical protein CV081_10255 [Nitrospira sp. LK265]|nr:hypothetical protein [Nitrospira sp.]NGZ60867.1 hypothetical protein [Nitrospira sp. LK265]